MYTTTWNGMHYLRKPHGGLFNEFINLFSMEYFLQIKVTTVCVNFINRMLRLSFYRNS